jgi:ABC-type lipoprotein export system ATPase subunit
MEADKRFQWEMADMKDRLEMQRESREKFLGWLVSPDAIFHIHGKLGSGKSTLMKFLSCHERTRSEARKWAGK